MLLFTNKFPPILFFALLFGLASFAQADWATLNSELSNVSFVSVKNQDIAEVHGFDSVSGSISESGAIQINIDPVSVNTAIGIRDERMKEHLFMVTRYPSIEINAQVNLESIQPGAQRIQLPATLSLAGKELLIELDVLVTSTDLDLTVSSATPVLIYTAQAGLTDGVAKLAELAGGISIGNAVPVNFALSFKR